MQFGEAVLVGDPAHGVLDRGLHVEDQVLGGAAQVEESPVQALVKVGVLVDGKRRFSPGDDLDTFGEDFQAAEFDLGVVDDLAGDLHGGFDGE